MEVSVPLPGFSGLRPEKCSLSYDDILYGCFSPVAGIQWVETPPPLRRTIWMSFSPVAGIQWVETNEPQIIIHGYSRSFSPVAGIQWVETLNGLRTGGLNQVSVPLPGFSGLRP